MPELRGSDLAVVREQLGRDPRTSFDVIVRCPLGHPLVIRNAPTAADGAPFPTMFWLTCPDGVAAVSRLEAAGWIERLNERYERDDVFRAEVDRAHDEAAAERARVLPAAGGWGGVGGTARGLKCLHAHYANHLAGGVDVVGAWVAAQIEPVHPEHVAGDRIAVIDQGTHSCRVLVVERARRGEPIELASDMIITKLGEGVDATGALRPEAVARDEFVFARYCRRARALHAPRIRVAATSAVRDATNRDLFVDMVHRHAGTDPEVIDGHEEARLSFLGGTLGLDPSDGPFLLLDIGGGSTEFVVGREPGVAEHRVSTQMGSVRLTERFDTTDPPDAGELARMRREIGDRLDEAELAVPELHIARTFVSVAGTATTIQAIALGLERYDVEATHRSWVATDDTAYAVAELASMTTAGRAALPVMARGRADVIVAGGEVLVASLRRLGFERTLVSETDILQGLAWDTLGLR
jgi:exopolyphosphatase / guanosine-5'-triphosphate,3'-diphosphate pyrophosphatase